MTFVYVSGRPSLDLVGTLKWRRRADAEEQLTEPALLAEWAVGAGLVDEPVRVSAEGLSHAIALREAVYRTIRARMAGRRADRADVELLNQQARRRPVTPELMPDGHVRRRATAGELLTTVAVDTIDLLAGTGIRRVRECSNADCTRLFLDTSRSGNRRWCGMAECGNRSKAATFRRLHHH